MTTQPLNWTMRLATFGVVMFALSTVSFPADAYQYRRCNLSAGWWPCDSGTHTVKWLPTTNPVFAVDGSWGSSSNCDEFSSFSNWRNDFNCAVKAMRDVGSSTISPTTKTDVNGWFYNDTDNENDVAFRSSSNFDPGVLATSLPAIICECCKTTRMQEADIMFNSSMIWYPGPLPPNNDYYTNYISFQSVALHEIGHALGLVHEDGELSTMDSLYPNGGWSRGNHSYNGRFWPHSDDVQGLNFFYPSGSVGRDLAVYRSWEGSNTTNGYAVDLTPVFPASIVRGNTINIQYTVENRGNENLSGVKVKYYFSTDAWIDPNTDTPAPVQTSLSFAPFEWRTLNVVAVVPTTLPPGDYYVGVYVDPADVFTGEASGSWNNGVHLPVGSFTNELLEVLP